MKCFPDVYYPPDIIPNRFAGKTMIVTGAASGIGRAVALRAAQEGAKVAVVDLSKEKAEIVVQEIIQAGGEAMSLVCDLSILKNTDEMVSKVHARFGRLDICVNNAGTMAVPKALHLQTKEEIAFGINSNIYATLFSCKSELKYLLEQNEGGVIINNSSMAGLLGVPNDPLYVAAKHAINGLTRALAIDYAPHHIRVNSVNPGPTATAMTANVDRHKAEMPFKREKVFNLQHRRAEPEEQASSILFLASQDASHITASLFATDGGYTTY